MPRTSRIHRPHSKVARTPPRAQPPVKHTLRRFEPEQKALTTPATVRAKPQRVPDVGFVAVGRVLGPFGLKGELKVQPLTDNPKRLAARSKVWAGSQPVTIVKSREAQDSVYVTLKGYQDRTGVERFRHAMLQVPEETLPALPEGEFYRFQLIGLAVVDRSGGVIGTLEEIIETGANDVYRVRMAEGADLLLPALDDVVLSIDIRAGRMIVDPPAWR